MAIRSLTQLKAWFQKGKYPTAAQFADWMDSFWHKEEEKIPISSVDELPARLNDKYNTADASVLEKRTQQVVEDLAAHKKEYAGEVDAIRTNLEELEAEAERLDGRITDETHRAAAEEEAIRRELAAGDAATLASANGYTDGRERAIREEMAAGDDATLAAAKAFTTEREGVLRSEMQAGDAATLQSANGYTDGREIAIREAMTTGDAATLQSAKSYTDTREDAVREEMTSGDAATLQSAKSYTNTREAAVREEMTAGDAATLQSAKSYTNTREDAVREELTAGDAATLRSAETYTDAREAAVRSDISSGNASTLASAKKYADDKIADVVGGSPEALDTLKELSAALGDDPNFAATVAGQIGGKVDKVAGKGLSTEDFTSAEKQKLAGIVAGANNYTHPASHPATMITADATHRFVSDTEKSTWNGKASTAVATQSANGLMTAADKKKLDGITAGANNYTHPASHPATMITTDETHQFVTATEKSAWNAKASTSAATQSANGLMSAADKKKLDGITAGANNYTHPASHPASMITTDETHRFITDAERDAWNSKPGAGTATGSSSGLMSAADKKKLDGIAAGANAYTHPASHPATMITEDATHRFVTDTEKSAWNAKASTSAATQSANGLMSAADKKKLDGIAAGANAYSHPASHPASMITTDETHQFVTATEKSAWNAKASTAVATQSANGLMSAADKKKLDGIATGANNYTHPANHPATIITEDATHRFVTDTEKSAWNAKASTAVATQSANGLMTAADKTKLDGISYETIDDYEEITITSLSGVEPQVFDVKLVPGFVIIRTRLRFTATAGRIITNSYTIRTSAVVDAYASHTTTLSETPGVKIRTGGTAQSTTFMFNIPNDIVNADVIIHCAIPVSSAAKL